MPGATDRRRTDRRTVMKALGGATLAGGALGALGPTAWAAPERVRGTVHDVLDHGAVGDGETDDTEAFQSAIDAIAESGGGTLRIPPRTYVIAPVTPVVLRADDMTVIATGATFRRPNLKGRPSIMFAANTRGEPGYGSGVRNLTWRGGRFVGDLSDDNAICPFGLHHAQHCLFEGIESENCHAPNSHQFDLGGCDDITIRHCTFRGQQATETGGGEAIQIDASFRGTLSGGTENVGFSGLPSRRITVEHCTFEPFTDAAGTVWPGPTPMGNHFAVEGVHYEDIRFAHNQVTDPRTAVLFGDHRDTWRGTVHFIAVHGLEIIGNTFTMTQSRQTRVIAANSINWGAPASADPDGGTPKDYWDSVNDMRDVVIVDNVITGFTVEDGVDEHAAIVCHGMADGEVVGLTVQGNTVTDGWGPDSATHAAGIDIAHAREVEVEDNTVTDRHSGIRLTSVSGASVTDNTVRNTTGTTFPAGITGRDVVDSVVQAGPTSGYTAEVELE